MVLGASRAEIFRLVLLRAIKSTAIGLISGIALAEPAMLLLNRLLARPLMACGKQLSIGASALLEMGRKSTDRIRIGTSRFLLHAQQDQWVGS